MSRGVWTRQCPECEYVCTGADYYNGWPTRDGFHHSLGHGMVRYAEAQRSGDPEGWTHAGCSHADGICTA